jgi:hypothetical protein
MANRKRKSTAQKQRAKERQQQRAALAAAEDGQVSDGSAPQRTAPQATAQRRPGDRPPRTPQRRRRSSRPSWILVGIVVVAVTAMVVVFATRDQGGGTGSKGSEAAIEKVTSVPESTLAQVGVPSGISAVPPLPAGTPPVVTDGKPVVTYVGAEYCPYCAAERWPVTVALSRFGTFSDLGTTTSGPKPEPLPDTPTLSYHGSSYTSDHLVFSSVETQDRSGNPLDTMTQQQQQLFSTYNTKQYTGSDGGIPFVMVGNLYAWAGTTYDPSVLEGLSFDQIANQLSKPSSPVAQQIDGAANQITAMICQLTDNQPSDVCSADFIQQAQAALPTP